MVVVHARLMHGDMTKEFVLFFQVGLVKRLCFDGTYTCGEVHFDSATEKPSEGEAATGG